MDSNVTNKKTPLFRVVKRGRGEVLPVHKSILVRAVAVILSLIVAGIVITLLANKNPIEAYGIMFERVFSSSNRFWEFMQNLAMLLCISLAVTPAFKMKFWNIGAEGQVLVGGLATYASMMYFGDSLPTPLLILVMVVTSVLAGMIWAVIPAIFKAKWGTNETLFTLMMNYVATQLVAFFMKVYINPGSTTLATLEEFGLPVIFGNNYLLNVLIVAVITVVAFIYLKYSKHGYEISVVGESEKTAKYIGINVKKVIIRTLLVSGAICGIAGLLLVGGKDHTLRTDTVGGLGFTAIMVSWLAKFNPAFMVLTSFLIVFLEMGTQHIADTFQISNSISDLITGIILFFIIGCEFFLTYKIVKTKNRKESN